MRRRRRIRTPEERRIYQERRRKEERSRAYEDRCRLRHEEELHQRSPGFTQDWMNDPRPLCPCCRQPSDTIAVRSDPYLLEYGIDSDWESCLGCWHARRGEI